MALRTWTLRRGNVDVGTVLVVTAHATHIDALADEIAAHGLYVFAAIPSAIPKLVTIASFDVVAILDDVPAADRTDLRALRPIRNRILEIDASSRGAMVGRIRERLLMRPR